MKKYLLLIFVLLGALSSCRDMNLVKQKIKSAADCSYCHPAWSWNNGVAKIKEYYNFYHESIYCPFEFIVKINGDLSFRYKINDNYLGGLSVGGTSVSFSDDEGGPTMWTLVKAGHVQIGDKIYFSGRECSVKDIIITGSIEENKPATEEPEDPGWDF